MILKKQFKRCIVCYFCHFLVKKLLCLFALMQKNEKIKAAILDDKTEALVYFVTF